MQRCFDDAAARHQVTVEGREHTARIEARVARGYERLDLADDTAIVRLMTKAAERLRRTFRTRATGGGCDANVFARRGLEVAHLGCGMRAIHTVREWGD